MTIYPRVLISKKSIRRMQATALCLIFFVAFLAGEGEEADSSSVDAVIDAVYASLTFKDWEKPDIERFRGLFAPEALFIRITKEGLKKMNTDSFIASFLQRIESGELKSFHESEVSRRSNAFGNIAQVFSVYKKGINTQDEKALLRGINSFQLYNDGQRWWICALVWQDLGDVPPGTTPPQK